MAVDGYRYEGADYLTMSHLLANYNDSIVTMILRYSGAAKDALDFGAGIGALAEGVRDRGLAPICLEPDDTQRRTLHGKGFGTIAALDEIEPASLDYIYSSNVLEHIENDVATLDLLRKKLRPRGRLFLYVPAFQSLYSSLDHSVGHWRRYDRTSLTAKLTEAHFTIEKIFYTDVLGYFVTQLYKAIGNKESNITPRSLLVYDRLVFPIGQLIERLIDVPFGKNIVSIATNPAAE